MTPLPARRGPAGWFPGWWMVGACAAIIVLAGGPFFYGFSVLVTPLQEEFGWTTLATAAAFSLRSEATAIAAPLTGVLIDRFGPRTVMVAGIIGVAAGFLWLSAINDLLAFYAAVFLISVGTTFCASQPAAIVISRWFVRLRSRAFTFVTMGGALSGLTVPVLAATVALLGWRGSLRVWAATVAAVCLPITLVIRPGPESLGLHPDGAAPPVPRARPAAGPGGRAIRTALPGATLRQGLRSRAFWSLSLSLAASNFCTTPAFVLLVPALARAGIPTEAAAVAAAAIPLASLPGRLIAGFWGDQADKRVLMAFGFGLQATGLVLLAATDSLPLLALFVAVFGTGFGAPLPLRSAIQADLFGLRALGSLQGMVTFATTLGGLVGPIVAGAIVDLSGDYRPGFLACAAVGALAVPLVLAIPGKDRPA